MAPSIKHKFNNPKGDPPDTTLVRPSNWNDDHAITLAADTVIARDSSGAGAAQETPCTAQGRAILAASDVAALCAALGIGVSTTGDVKFTIKTAADAGWIMANDGTIGSATSGATHANADCADLYAVLWAIPDTYAPVTGGRGATAAADFAANKPIALTKMLGRTLAVAGAGTGLTARALGAALGEETHVLTKTEAPTGLQTLNFSDPGHGHVYNYSVPQSQTGAGGGYSNVSVQSAVTSTNTTGISASLTDHGGNGAHPNMQPTSFLNVMVKL